MAERRYDPHQIEPKWQKAWVDGRDFEVDPNSTKPKFYSLEMFVYPSGNIHMGHVRNYALVDAVARYRRMRGFNVLHPVGWDAFGLPAENAAIKHNTHPEVWTRQCIANMKRQLLKLGFSLDWSREFATCDVDYYRWNQWFFIKMFERGLAYRKKSTLNWCPMCETTLANEQVVGGWCWRHEDTLVESRDLEQWFLKITDYADELNAYLDKLTGFPDRTLLMQRNWIGKSEGANIDFPVENSSNRISVFTTRIDTIFGATYMVLAPEHRIVDELVSGQPEERQVKEFREKTRQEDKAERASDPQEKEGVFTGRYALNPFSGERMPIWIGNFVVMEYGTGAVMSVPAHDQRDFEFALKYRLPVRLVIQNRDHSLALDGMREAFIEDGILVESGEFSGQPSSAARASMTAKAERGGFGKSAIQFRIKDWGISRQRYWGTPIPMIHCERCGVVPVPEKDLPVILPRVERFTGTGGSPLSTVPEFINVNCPRCDGMARRDSDTMDTFVDSSWYFFRYCDPRNSDRPFEPKSIDYWFPIDLYIGGIEHAILHLIYSRFWTKMMRDLDVVKVNEPIANLFHLGMVLKDGAVMSKSKGNIVDPDDIVSDFGADTARMFILFLAPPEKELDWDDAAVAGMFKFLQKVFRLVAQNTGWMKDFSATPDEALLSAPAKSLRRKMHQTIKRVSDDLEHRLHFNVSIAAMMELHNEMSAVEAKDLEDPGTRAVFKESCETLIRMISVFAPHIAEEMWELNGHSNRLTRAAWPEYNELLAAEEEIEIPIQINGKVRGRILVAADVSEAEMRERALGDTKVKSWVGDKTVVKFIVVPKRLVNIVVR
ncbi:MAG: leucine--tRNA ligase [Acidobacteriia bacterium]|nr:leucine--tRNA ligase [Terriglobia bacterium]